MRSIAGLHVLTAEVVSRDPGLGHDLRYGAILLAAVLFIAVWMRHIWRNAPDPEERWRQAREGVGEHDDAETPS